MSEIDSSVPRPGECVAPVLPMRDIDVTAAFYEALGFTRQRRYDRNYLVIASGWMELHFFQHPECDPLTSIAGAFIRVDDVDAVTAGFAALVPADPRGTPRFLPAVVKPWGMKQAILVDPDGNLVQFGTLELFPIQSDRSTAPALCVSALSSREPVSTSLENAPSEPPKPAHPPAKSG